MEGHAKNCVETYFKRSPAILRSLDALYRYHQFKKEKLETVGELSKVSCQIVFNCLYLARIGRRDILWSVNKLGRAVTKWTGACDKRLASDHQMEQMKKSLTSGKRIIEDTDFVLQSHIIPTKERVCLSSKTMLW